MAKTKTAPLTPEQKAANRAKTWTRVRRDKWMYLLLVPGILFFIIFKIVPLWGILIAFKDYFAGVSFLSSEWIGFRNFTDLFTDPIFLQLLRNTLVISFMNLIFYFPLPIIMALLLNEIRVQWYKKTLQTLVYVPHFVSLVVVTSITMMLIKNPLSEGFRGGVILEFVRAVSGNPDADILANGPMIYWILLFQAVWKETGWGTIIFLAAIAGVDVEQYEAAIVDGASRFQQLIYITFPAITGTIVTMLILRMGSVLDTGFEQILLMRNANNIEYSETFDTYVYQYGRVEGNYGYSTAVGLFKSVISLICIQSANRIAKKVGQAGLF